MSRRRRLIPPLIPGFWMLILFLLVLGSVGGYFFALANMTVFERVPEEAPAKVK